MKPLHSLILVLGLGQVLLRATPVSAAPAPWPQWRGPLANGTSPDARPPIEWSETKGVKWKYTIPGNGASTPIVWGDLVFLLTAVPVEASGATPPPTPEPTPATPATGPSAEGGRPRRGGGGTGGPGGGMRSEQPTAPVRFKVLAIDRTSGRLRWEHTAREIVPHEGHHRDHGYASFSPVTDGRHLFVNYGSRGLHAYDFEGRRLWDKDLGRMTTRNGFGEGSSVALHGETLVVLWDHEGADFIAAFDKKDGKELWRRERDEPTTWTTPLIVEHAGKPQVIVPATGRIRAYDLASGQSLWECAGMTGNVIPTPVVLGDLVFPISGFRGAALLAIRLGRTGDLTGTDAVVWSLAKATPYVPSPLLLGERLYFYSGNTAILSAADAKTGRLLLDAVRIEGLGGVYASPVAADGRIYLVGREGKTVVLRHGESLETLATNSLDDQFDASPALVGDDLFLRGHRHLYALSRTP